MRCCVQTCKNDSRHISKSQGITFHIFPTEPSLRASWLKALDKEFWEPRERSAVCSEHFLPEDLYETRNGLRKVRAGAVPFLMQDDSKCEYDESSLQVCRICFAMDCKLYYIKDYTQLEQAYEAITGIMVRSEEVPQYLCVQCAHRLATYNRFKNETMKAYSVLLDITKRRGVLTIDDIKLAQDNRQPQLSVKHNQPDHYDLVLEYDENHRELINTIQDEPPALLEVTIDDIKSEKAVFIDEEHYGDVREDVVCDAEHLDQGFSSDDSAPLVKRKKKTKVAKESVKRVRKKPQKEPPQPKIDRRRKPFLNDELNETLFTITDLTFEEQVAEIQKRQESSNYKNSVFKCTACFKGFLDEDAYNGHVTRHTDQCGEYECEICKTHFKHQHALRKHITAHHSQRFSCNQCPYVTTHRQTARLHERWHKGTKYQCPHCQDEFVKFTTYMGHIRIKHPSDFVCELCGYSFVSEKGIELHKKLKHRLENGQVPEDGPFCELCNVRFVSAEAHRRHLNVSARHAGDDKDSKDGNRPKKGRKPREDKDTDKRRDKGADEEGDRKMYPSQLRRAEGPIPCEQCGLQLEDSRAYHGHFRRMHPDKNRTNYPSMKSPCMCEVCGRMFQSYALLKDHRWTHTGERPFACDACGKAFRMRQRLVAHRRVHAPARHYRCALCGKSFSTHSNRTRHMFIHTGLKPFKCEMCGKCFKHASEKRAHITYVHLKKPWPKRARGKRRADRPGQIAAQGPVAGASEMDIGQPLWPCDPKLDINAMMEDKPVYYNLKI